MKLWPPIFSLYCFALGFSQQTNVVDFKNIHANLDILPQTKVVHGEMEIMFDVLQSTDSIFLDAHNMHFKNVRFNSDSVNWSTDGTKLWIIHSFESSSNNKLTFSYNAKPKKALYFVGWTDPETSSGQVWTQGQGKYTSNWLPSIDDMNDKIEFDLSITFYKNYEVIANGDLTNTQTNDSTITWHYDMQKPMSSYLVALAIGKYNKKLIQSESGVPIELYYYPEDSIKFEPTYRYTKEMFDFLEKEIGVPYPWQHYKQVPVKDFLYAGMENTSLTIFSDRYVVDSTAFVDRNYVNVNAHELAHQWFGDLVTETSGTHHWLQEGFATYYALLAEKDIFGEDYYYWQLYEYAQELLEQDRAGGSTSLLDPQSSSTTFYKKGAWVLHLLREQIGDVAFKAAVKSYLKTYQFRNVETDDFINEAEKASGQDLSDFVETWLESPDLNYKALENRFFQNNVLIQDSHGKFNPWGLKQYYPLDCEIHPEACKIVLIQSKDSFLNEKIVEQLGNHISKSTFLTDDIKTRQAIARTMTQIPTDLKTDYESLLNDASYLTKELALLNLWKNFPEKRSTYLNQTKDLEGFNDKNIKTLWLTLALITDDYEPNRKVDFYNELIAYTHPSYHFEIRQNAFQYLNSIQACNDTCKKHLEQASKHPVWQFSKLAKELLKSQ